jgi:hypothetical protein
MLCRPYRMQSYPTINLGKMESTSPDNFIFTLLVAREYFTRLITTLCQECGGYLLRIRVYTYTILHITITLNLIQSNISISIQLYLGQCWTSTVFSGDYPKTVLRMQSPFYICGRCHAVNLLLSPWILLLELQQSYCYFLGNGLRCFHRSVSSRLQTCNNISKSQISQYF